MRVVWLTDSGGFGGSDHVLVEVLRHLDQSEVELILAGNPNPQLLEGVGQAAEMSLTRSVTRLRHYDDSRVVRRLRHLRARARWEGSPSDEPVPSALHDQFDGRSVHSPAEMVVSYLYFVPNLLRLCALFLRLRPDVVQISNGGYPGGRGAQIAAVAAKWAGVPAVVHLIQNTAEWPARPTGVERMLDRIIDRHTNMWIVPSDMTGRELVQRRDIAPGRVRTLYAGVSEPAARAKVSDLGFTPSSLNIVMVGALVARKGFATAISAFERLRRAGVDFRVAIAGDGYLRDAIECRLRELDLTSRVRLLGQRDDVDALFAEADVLLVSSTSHEALPTVIMEAMAHAKPIVATAIAGIPEQITEGVHGLLVAPGDPEALAAALRRLAENPLDAAEMGREGRARMSERFTAARFVAELETLWRESARHP